MRFLKSRLLTSIIVLLTTLMCIAVGVLALNVAQETVAFRTPYMFLNGEYSADGEEFKSFDPNEPINDHFKKITFKGTLIPKDTGELWEEITFTTKNMWYSLYSADGELLLTSSYQTLDQWCDDYYETDDGSEYTEEEKKEYKKRLLSKNPFKFDMPDTPGYSEMIMKKEEFEDSGFGLDSELIMEFEIPYDISLGSFSDLFTVTMSDGNGIHMRIMKIVLPIVFLFAIVCMFGIFFFPVASFILGRINYKYL